jgi:hypothetical protein
MPGRDPQTSGMNSILDVIAEQNGGYVTRAEALDSGVTDRDLALACRLGLLRHIRHGAYAPAETYDPLTEEAKHLVRARATVARQTGQVALTGVSAAAAHGLCLYGHDLGLINLVRLDGGSSRRRVSARHQVVRDPVADHLELKDGLLITNLARTVWEIAGRSTLEAGVATADSALRVRPELVDELAEIAPTFTNRPGSRLARKVISLADGRAESPGESYSRVLFHRFHVPKPELQYHVRNADDGLMGIADFCWEAERHLGEFDGKVKYGRLLRDGETPADAVFREKRREDGMRGELFGMSRWVWAELSPLAARRLVNRINADRERSRRLYTRNRTIIA